MCGQREWEVKKKEGGERKRAAVLVRRSWPGLFVWEWRPVMDKLRDPEWAHPSMWGKEL